MFDTVDVMLQQHMHEWGPVQVVRGTFALIDVTK